MAQHRDGAAAAQNCKKVRGRPFTKGEDSRRNAGGRPKEYRAFKERCRQFMDDEGFPVVAEKARGGDTFALKLLCEYGYGKAPEAEKPEAPTQKVEITWTRAQRKAEEDA